MSFELNKAFVQDISNAIENRRKDYIIRQFEGSHAADISALLEQLDSASAKYILDALDPEICADILSNLEEDTQKNFLKLFESKEIAYLMDYTDSDDAVDILQKQPLKIREEVITLMQDRENTRHIIDLLPYEDDCAGGLMAKEFISANINWTVRQCIEEIRRQAQKVEKVLAIYVVDDNDILMGRLSLKKIIITHDDTLIKDIYLSDIQTVQTYYSDEEVADIMQKYDLEVIPVINIKGKILGRITIDDIVDVITEQAERDRQMMSGITEDVEADDSIWMLSRARLPWLVIGVMGGLLGAQFIGFFEEDISIIPAMAFFIPLITATGGNVGIQSSTIIVQTLASVPSLGESIFSHLLKALLVSIVNGLFIAGLVFIFNFFFANSNLAFIVSIALFCVVLLASFMGTLTPLVLNKAGINPALASGPFITTANDLLGLLVYFVVARILII